MVPGPSRIVNIEKATAGHDGRDAAHHVDEQGDRGGELAAVRVFDQVHGAHQTDRNGDNHSASGDFESTDDGVQHTAVTTGRGLVTTDHTGHVVAQEVQVQALDAVDDSGPQQGDQRDAGDHKRHRDQGPHEVVHDITALDGGTGRAETIEVDFGRAVHRSLFSVLSSSHHAVAFSVSLRAMKLTTNVIRNRIRPVPISVETPRSLASGYCAAIFAAMVWFCEACSSLME